MRIALACPYAWDAPGGVQVHVRELAERLEGKGHDVVVLAPAWDRPADPYVRVVGRPTKIRYQGTVAPICPSPASWRWIGAALRAFRPDVLHAHEPFTPSTALYATLASKAPVVGTFHAYADRSRLLGSAAPLLRPAWRKLKVRVAVSRAAAAFVSNRFDGDVRVAGVLDTRPDRSPNLPPEGLHVPGVGLGIADPEEPLLLSSIWFSI